MAKEKQTLTKAQIDAKKNDFAQAIKEEAERARSGRNTAARAFLMEIKDLVKDGFESGLSARQLAKQIYRIYNFKISEQTIRTFASSVLGIVKTKKED